MVEQVLRRYESECYDVTKKAAQGRHTPESSTLRETHHHIGRCRVGGIYGDLPLDLLWSTESIRMERCDEGLSLARQ
jgi:hypothetical protein